MFYEVCSSYTSLCLCLLLYIFIVLNVFNPYSNSLFIFLKLERVGVRSSQNGRIAKEYIFRHIFLLQNCRNTDICEIHLCGKLFSILRRSLRKKLCHVFNKKSYISNKYNMYLIIKRIRKKLQCLENFSRTFYICVFSRSHITLYTFAIIKFWTSFLHHTLHIAMTHCNIHRFFNIESVLHE